MASFSFYAIIVGLTGWFVLNTLRGVGQPPTESGDTGAKPLESINVKLMDNLEQALDQKTDSPIDDLNSLTNPFLPRAESAPTPEPAPTPGQPGEPSNEASASESEAGETGDAADTADESNTPDAEADGEAAPTGE